MSYVCRRCASSVTPESRASRLTGVQNLPKKINDDRAQEGARRSKNKISPLGIRQIVRARSQLFQAELKNISQEEYMLTSLKEKIARKFHGKSTREMLAAAAADRSLRSMDNIGKPQNEDQISYEAFKDHSDISSDEATATATFAPGDLIEYWPDRGKRKTCIILLQPSSNKRYTAIDSRGSIDYLNPNRFSFVIRQFFTGALPTLGRMRIGDRLLAGPVRALNSFKKQTALLTSEKAGVLSNIAKHLPQRLKDLSTVVSVKDVSRHCLNRTDNVAMYATFEAMYLDRLHFLPDPALYLSVPYLSTRSAAEVDVIQSVQQWTRDKTSEYQSFVKKAKEIHKYYSSIPVSEDNLRLVPSPITFDRSDGKFIRFMLEACLERPAMPGLELYTVSLGSIIKDLGFFSDEVVERLTVHNTLKQLGIIRPWDSNLLRNYITPLPGTEAAKTLEAHDQLLTTKYHPVACENLTKLGLRDTSDHLRHDFGQLPVYTIDGPDAMELDDGLSIEDDWIHIHIADPSSFIGPHDDLAEIARTRLETMYLVDRSIPMLPSALAQRHFSLTQGAARPTVTTSVRLSTDGVVQDVLIRCGIIRNTTRLTYEGVDQQVFAHQEQAVSASHMEYNWRPVTARAEAQSMIPAEDINRLQSMASMLETVFQQRLRNGLVDSFNDARSMFVQPSPLPSTDLSYTHPFLSSGQPGIQTVVNQGGTSRSINLVTEAAILANAATAMFGREHKIPMVYRRMSEIAQDDELGELLKKRDTRGRVSALDMLPYIARIGATQLSTEPGPAGLLGLPLGYVHATSPLRRYTDMVAQWHIQAYLKGEKYPIDLESFLPQLIRQSRTLKRIKKSSSRHWVLQLLSYKMQAGEKLEFEATILANNAQAQHPSEAMLQDVRERCLVLRSLKDPVVPVGQSIRVRIVRLDLYDNVIFTQRI